MNYYRMGEIEKLEGKNESERKREKEEKLKYVKSAVTLNLSSNGW